MVHKTKDGVGPPGPGPGPGWEPERGETFSVEN